MDWADSILKCGTDRCLFSSFRSITGRSPPDFFLTMNRSEYKPGYGSFTFSMAPFFKIESTSFSNVSLFTVSEGSATGRGVLDRGGRYLNFSFNRSLNVSKSQRSDVIFSDSVMKCFSLPPTGSSESVEWDGRVDISRMLSLSWSICLLFIDIALTCSVMSTPLPIELSMILVVLLGMNHLIWVCRSGVLTATIYAT